MKKIYKITIPKPCNEDWNKMSLNQKGRFCDSCSKTVIDFSKLSTYEIQDFLHENSNKKICGHFKKTQLDTIHLSIPIEVIQKQYSFRKSFLLALLITAGTTLISCTDSEGKKQKIETIQLIKNSKPANNPIIKTDRSIKKCNTTILTEQLDKEPLKETFTKPKKNTSTNQIEEIEGEIEIIQGFIAPTEPINLNVPIDPYFLETYPSFKNLKKKERTSKNFSKEIQEFVSKEFNTLIGTDIHLKGIQRIYVSFEINKKGAIKNIKTKGPHLIVEQEAERVIKKIPRLHPGTYQNQHVSCIFQIPIVYKVKE